MLARELSQAIDMRRKQASAADVSAA